jgi:hypothetical protein
LSYSYSSCYIQRSDICFLNCVVCNTCCADDWRCKTEHREYQVRRLHYVYDETCAELSLQEEPLRQTYHLDAVVKWSALPGMTIFQEPH